ncbi:MAG: hypothetical protein KC646_06505 [Candidatus Cloacimonetes bacterium]|nr:hypothetical protein [Candidatus Cloacimonadota bacterium]
MKKVGIGLFLLLLVALCGYLYLSSPSTLEKQADKFYQSSQYDDAAHYYQLAYAEGNLSFKKERILFKIGNAYRLAGERERSFDFYFMVLQENKNSVYKSRIQEFLRDDGSVDDSSIAFQQDIEVDLDFLKDTDQLSLKETIEQRNKLYKILVMAVVSDNLNLSYQLKDLYKGFKKLQIKVDKSKKQAAISLFKKRLKRDRREMLFIGFEKELKQALISSSSNYKLIIHEIESANEVIDLKADIQPQAVYISYQNEFSSMGADNFITFLERMSDSYENTKFFLMIDDSSSEGLSEILKSVDDQRVFTLLFQDQKELRSKIKQSLKARFLWQSNG